MRLTVGGISVALRGADMTASTINRTTEKLLVGASACVIIGGVAASDMTIRGHLMGVFQGRALPLASSATAEIQRAWHRASLMVGYQGTDDPTLIVFAVAALVLFFLMFKM